jgi:putative glycosyltransferase (TIGR04372 family)
MRSAPPTKPSILSGKIDLATVERSLLQKIPGSERDNPFIIVALLNARAVGDLIFYHIYAASVKRLFKNAILIIYQRNDREYKSDLLSLNTEKDAQIVAQPEFGGIPIDNFQMITDFAANKEPFPKYIFMGKAWMRPRCHKAHLILSPATMPETLLSTFEHPAFLKIPDAQVERLSRQLVEHGVDPKRWFCVINYREPGYKHRPNRELRDLNPKTFMALAEDVIENLGGQVVRIGHPNMTPFPSHPGFIDLASVDQGFLLHSFAVSRARFVIGSPTGMSHMGSAMNTPTGMTNCSDPLYVPGCWRDHDVGIYMHVYDSDGRRVSTMEQHERELHQRTKLISLRDGQNFHILENTAEELGLVARCLMETTMKCQGWREPSTPSEPKQRPNTYQFPVSPRIRVPILEYPDLAPIPT